MPVNLKTYIEFEKDEEFDPERLNLMQDMIQADIAEHRAERANIADRAAYADKAKFAELMWKHIYSKVTY